MYFRFQGKHSKLGKWPVNAYDIWDLSLCDFIEISVSMHGGLVLIVYDGDRLTRAEFIGKRCTAMEVTGIVVE